MKTKTALVVGIICIVISALTLFSVLSHADSDTSTISFTNTGGVSSSIQSVSILEKHPTLVKIDVSPMSLPKGDVSTVFVKFPSDYEAFLGHDILMHKKVDLLTSYVKYASIKSPVKVVAFVNGEGQVDSAKAPQGVLIYSADISVGRGKTLQDLVSDRVRDNELNRGIYVGLRGGVMQVWDHIWCQGVNNENDPCHNNNVASNKKSSDDFSFKDK